MAETPSPLDLADCAHRPIPPPPGPPLLRFGWHGTAFLHWALPPEAVEARVPAGVQLDTHAGKAWVSAVAFHLVRTRHRSGLPLAGRRVAELNLRTYVTGPQGPGALFWTLDAPDPRLVAGGRAFGVPYRMARVTLDRDGVDSEPRGGARFAAGWASGGSVEPDDLDEFLHERYVLYAQRPGRAVVAGGVHHAPWPLREMEAWPEELGDLAAWFPELAGRIPDRARWSPGVEAAAWRPRPFRVR